MSNTLLEKIVEFDGLEKSDKVKFICSRLSRIGCEYQLQSFESIFGRGTNIVIFQIGKRFSPVTVLTSHYDGETFYDNTCGVLSLLEITKKIYLNKLNKNFVIVFTDQEELHQQGSYFFLKDNCELEINLNINIDGFGIGENIYSTDCLNLDISSIMLQTDSSYFSNEKIKTTSLFSSFESEVIKSKKEDLFLVFKDYLNADFFFQRFDIKNYNNLNEILWKYVSSIE